MCGYCNGALVKVGQRYECPGCAPLLALVATPEQWAEFQRQAARRLADPAQQRLL